MYQFVFRFNICIPDLSANIKSKREKISNQKIKLQIEAEIYSLESEQLIFRIGTNVQAM